MAKSLNQAMQAYRAALQTGQIQQAYRGLLAFMLKLRTHLSNKYPAAYTASSLHQGAMDISYFAFTPDALRQKKLKVAIVFNHEATHFELWLTGQNKAMHKKYWNTFRNSNWTKDNIAPTPEHMVLRETIVGTPDFDQLDELMIEIEERLMTFIQEVSVVLT